MATGRAESAAEKQAVVSRILAAWDRVPALRLGQFIDCANTVRGRGDVFDVEDFDLAEACERFAAKGGAVLSTTIPAYCAVPLCEPPCRGPMVTRAEHHRGGEYRPGVRLVCLNCGDGIEGTDAQVAQAEQARDAWAAEKARGA